MGDGTSVGTGISVGDSSWPQLHKMVHVYTVKLSILRCQVFLQHKSIRRNSCSLICNRGSPSAPLPGLRSAAHWYPLPGLISYLEIQKKISSGSWVWVRRLGTPKNLKMNRILRFGAICHQTPKWAATCRTSPGIGLIATRMSLIFTWVKGPKKMLWAVITDKKPDGFCSPRFQAASSMPEKQP